MDEAGSKVKRKIARVFPRRTKASPTDELAFFGPPGLFPPKVDEVHVSVTFTWDMALAEHLAKQWQRVAPVKLGGPATDMPGGQFTPGLYLAPGYVITSRGCPNRCWFCNVWRRDGTIHELDVVDGWNVLDDNLLACTGQHICDVFSMLRRQKQPIQFTGGLEAARLLDWHVELLRRIKLGQMFFAYDTPDDYEPLVEAGKKLMRAGFPYAGHRLRAYVLIGHPQDTFEAAERRLMDTIRARFFPMAMLWRGLDGKRSAEWVTFQRHWARPEIVNTRSRELWGDLAQEEKEK